MKMINSLRFLLFSLIVFFASAFGQDSIRFDIDVYFGMILKNHPIIKQAKLLDDLAQREVQQARGEGFDPKIQSNYDVKTFSEKRYFEYWQNQLKLPTWFGAEFKLGYDKTGGTLINPDRTMPTNGMTYFGVSVPIGQGLFMDQRRANLRIAQNLREMNKAERNKVVIKILYEASKSYWEWYARYFRYQKLEEGYQLAMNRYKFVKSRIQYGEEAGIDSTEAVILLQNRFVVYKTAEMEFQNSFIDLNLHIWDDNEQGFELNQNLRPTAYKNAVDIERISINQFIEKAKINHPEILKINAKLKQLAIERRLANENLKPTLNLNYNFLTYGLNMPINGDVNFLKNNYKAGFDFVFPVFLRKERAKQQLNKIKINQTEFELSFLNRSILNEINKFYNELTNIQGLLLVQEKLVKDYVVLRDGEYEKFYNGESSLFLVNTRESNLIESQIKLVEMQSKYEKAKAGLYWSSGSYQLKE